MCFIATVAILAINEVLAPLTLGYLIIHEAAAYADEFIIILLAAKH